MAYSVDPDQSVPFKSSLIGSTRFAQVFLNIWSEYGKLRRINNIQSNYCNSDFGIL